MDLQLKDKKILITGATRGIGFGVVRRFAEAGAQLWIHGSNKKSCEVARIKLLNEYPSAAIVESPCDFLDNEALFVWINALPEMDVLVNNLGIYRSEPFFDMSDEGWFQQHQVNVMGGVRLCRHFMPKMLKKGWGRILFVSSECSQLVPEDLIAYSTTKAALETLTKGLAKLTRNTAVTVNCIQPGSTLTEGAENFLQNQSEAAGKTVEEIAEEFFTAQRPASTLQRFATVDEVASTLVYFCSPLAAATNGSCIAVDGGSTLGT